MKPSNPGGFMRILMCLTLLVSFSSTSFAYTPSNPGELDRALDRLDIVFASARTKHTSLWRSVVYGGISGVVVYTGLVRWTGSTDTASRIFNYALAGSVFWGIADGIAENWIDRTIARKARPAREYMDRQVLPDFFQLPRARQLELTKSDPSLEQFILRLDEAIQNTAPVVVDAPVATPRTF